MSFACTLCGSTNWPREGTDCPLCCNDEEEDEENNDEEEDDDCPDCQTNLNKT